MSSGTAHDALRLLPQVVRIAREAGREILEVYESGPIDTRLKDDASPLTAADLRAHRCIADALRLVTPDIPVFSEEAAATPWRERSGWERYWLVDPLDGTREFLSRNGQFTVNIALIEGHTPVLGVVHVPVTHTTYSGVVGAGAWRAMGEGAATAIRVRTRCASPIQVVGSRSHRGDSLDDFLHRLGAYQLQAIGSSLKFCLLAEGAADVYPRLGPTSEWDTAAAQAVLSGAGGEVRQLDGLPLRYNTRDSVLNPHFVAFGPRQPDWLELLRGRADAKPR